MRALSVILAATLVFAAVAALMWRLMPAPFKNSDYMVIGSVATLAAMLAAFLMLISTSKTSDVFFKKRRKP